MKGFPLTTGKKPIREVQYAAMTYKTLAEAVRGLKERGFTPNLELLQNTFRDVGTGKTFQPGELAIVEHHRFEGVSDPDDLLVELETYTRLSNADH